MNKTIYDRIRERRIQLGLSQEDLAIKMGYKSRSTINKIESGAVDIARNKIEKFAEVLNTTPAYLMGWQEPHQANKSITSNQTEGYYVDPETAEFAEYLRTRPGARMLFSAAKDITKEEMEETVKYIEFLKSKHK